MDENSTVQIRNQDIYILLVTVLHLDNNIVITTKFSGMKIE